MIPACAEPLDSTCVRLLLALVLVHEARGRAVMAEVGVVAGVRSTETVHRHLRHLRAEGWIDWSDGRAGTLHPLCARVAA